MYSISLSTDRLRHLLQEIDENDLDYHLHPARDVPGPGGGVYITAQTRLNAKVLDWIEGRNPSPDSTTYLDVVFVHEGQEPPEVHPEDYLTRSHVALTYHTTGKLAEGAEQYRLIIEESTCEADRNLVVYTTALLFLGRSYLRMEELEKARDYIHRAEEVDDEYVLTKLSLAEVYAELNEPQRAVEYAEWILQREPQLTFFPIDQDELEYSALCLAGRGYQALGDFSKAEAAFVRAAEMPVNRRAEALGSLSEVHKAAGDRDKALQALRSAVDIDPNSAKHVFNIGMLHLEAAELADAAANFHRVLEIVPNYAPAILNLGYIAKQEERYEEAESLYQELIELEPGGIEARANLAHLYLDLERFEQAIESFEKVRKLDAGLLDINLGLLLSQSATGDIDLELAQRTTASLRRFQSICSLRTQQPRASLNSALCSLERGS